MSIKPSFEQPEYPMRINRYLAWKGYATRRAADDLVARRKVTINGKPAELGSKVQAGDSVKVTGAKDARQYRYYAYYKPIGIMTGAAEGEGRDIMGTVVGLKGVFPLGRLDKASHGLMILTDDGRVTDRLLNPERAHEREYLVRVKGKLRSSFKAKMEKGVDIEGYVTKPCRVEIAGENTFRVTLTEGKKHQIRRMCVALFQEVADLKRVRIATVTIGKIGPNEYRPIEGAELAAFLGGLGL